VCTVVCLGFDDEDSDGADELEAKQVRNGGRAWKVKQRTQQQKKVSTTVQFVVQS